MLALLGDARLADPVGAEDTVDYGPPLGALRLDYVLPAAGLTVAGAKAGAGAVAVAGAGVLRPDGLAEGLAAALRLSSRHWPVWVDLVLPSGRS
ncbi:hypothetical protein HYN69_01330 [Gemmobacter aquarius]|uniref:Uncharacterized protein n=1 Tax=Paragemmobacter aquarius TaxID=2169400 RepID=A0A2S0UHP0_9RHOB|nr:hypothetical protein HYN69_01330 [Gemmobacter aquarius]